MISVRSKKQGHMISVRSKSQGHMISVRGIRRDSRHDDVLNIGASASGLECAQVVGSRTVLRSLAEDGSKVHKCS
eukprot:76977-Hanusia_phi.AAC.3